MTFRTAARTPVSTPAGLGWVRVAFAMFAVGWGANQFSTMLIVYRHALGLSPGAVAGLFAVYGATLIPALLVGGPLSDRYGRRAVALPFVALSPLATLLLVLGDRSIPAIATGRALAGLCSGIVFGAATAWVRDLSGGDAHSARRSALALSAGFGLGPVVAALLAQWAGDPLVVPYLPHLLIGTAALAAVWPAPDTAAARGRPPGRWPPAAVRTRRFWLTVGLPAPVVFGSISLAIVVLPAEVTSARSLSAGFAGLVTALAFAAGARPSSWPGPHDRGAVLACYYVLAYLGFVAPYAVDGLTAALGRAGAFTALAGGAALLTGWMWVQAARVHAASRPPSSRTQAAASRSHADSPSSG